LKTSHPGGIFRPADGLTIPLAKAFLDCQNNPQTSEAQSDSSNWPRVARIFWMVGLPNLFVKRI
jgi:hypothetical protein